MSSLRLQCDAPECEAMYPPVPDERGYAWLQAVIRTEATAAGWSVSDIATWRRGPDFCPEHASP